MDRSVPVEVVGRTLRALLETSSRHLSMRDRITGEVVAISPDLATSSRGFLPVFLVVADAVWRDASGNSFGIGLARDPSSLLGYRSQNIAVGPYSAVMLSMMEAIEQTARPGVLLMNDFDRLWRSIESGMATAIGAGPHSSPSLGGR